MSKKKPGPDDGQPQAVPSQVPWEVVKAKHGVDPGDFLVASILNGTEDMTLFLVSKTPGEPYENAEAIRASVKACAGIPRHGLDDGVIADLLEVARKAFYFAGHGFIGSRKRVEVEAELLNAARAALIKAGRRP